MKTVIKKFLKFSILLMIALSFFSVNSLTATTTEQKLQKKEKKLLDKQPKEIFEQIFAFFNDFEAKKFCTTQNIYDEIILFLLLTKEAVTRESNFTQITEIYLDLASVSDPAKRPNNEIAKKIFKLVSDKWNYLLLQRKIMLENQKRLKQTKRTQEKLKQEKELRRVEEEHYTRQQQLQMTQEAEEREQNIIRTAQKGVTTDLEPEGSIPRLTPWEGITHFFTKKSPDKQKNKYVDLVE